MYFIHAYTHTLYMPIHILIVALHATIVSCLNRNATARPKIDGPRGLLRNEFLIPRYESQGEDVVSIDRSELKTTVKYIVEGAIQRDRKGKDIKHWVHEEIEKIVS